ncbi:MAG: AI-2E family transporter [Nanobdellota archaeon]
MKKEEVNKNIFMALSILLFVLAFMIAKPFISDLLTAIILAYIFYPLYKIVLKKVKSKHFSSFIIVFLIFLIIAIPIIWTATSFYGQVKEFMVIQDKLPGFLSDEKTESSNLSYIKNLGEIISKRTDIISKSYQIYEIISKISYTIIHFFLSLFMTFFFIKDGHKFVNFLKKLLKNKREYNLEILKTIEKTIHAVIYGIVIVALIQGIVSMIAYGTLSAFGALSNPIFWGVLTFFAAFIPTIGTGLIWLPLSLFLIIQGIFTENIPLIIMGSSLIAYGSLIIGTIDNFIRPKLIGDRAEIHPVVVLVGVLGGVSIFGFIGIIIGPLTFAITQQIIVLYKENKLF